MSRGRLSPTTRAQTHARPNSARTYAYTSNRFALLAHDMDIEERKEICALLPFGTQHRLTIETCLACNTAVRKHDEGWYLELAEELRVLREGWQELLELYA